MSYSLNMYPFDKKDATDGEPERVTKTDPFLICGCNIQGVSCIMSTRKADLSQRSPAFFGTFRDRYPTKGHDVKYTL